MEFVETQYTRPKIHRTLIHDLLSEHVENVKAPMHVWPLNFNLDKYFAAFSLAVVILKLCLVLQILEKLFSESDKN